MKKVKPSVLSLKLQRMTNIADTMWAYIVARGLQPDVDKWMEETGRKPPVKVLVPVDDAPRIIIPGR